jgi:hypothetical protein
MAYSASGASTWPINAAGLERIRVTRHWKIFPPGLLAALGGMLRFHHVRIPRAKPADAPADQVTKNASLGLQELRRAVVYANAANHPAGPVLAAELSRIADLIEAGGWHVGGGLAIDRLRELERLAPMAADVEQYGGQPVAATLAEAVRSLTRRPTGQPLTAAQWVRQLLWKRRNLWPRNYGAARSKQDR